MLKPCHRKKHPALIAVLASAALTASALLILTDPAAAEPIALQNGTATFNQTITQGHSPDLSIDGDFSNGNLGWAIATGFTGDITSDQTAVWETVSDTSASTLNFAMHQNFFIGKHLIGQFRFSITSDNRSLFADGLDTMGDVTANWTVLTNPMSSGPASLTFTTQGDNSILVGGTIPNTGTYNIQYTGTFSNITGIRLEVLEDASLPFNGPGLYPDNGNFVLTELVLTTIVPEPTSATLLGLATITLVLSRRRKVKTS